MQNTDITAKVKNFIRLSLVCVLAAAAVVGYAEFKYWHEDEIIRLDEAKVAGTMVSVRVLANGKVKELLFKDGAEVKAGDVIARLEVAITEEEIQQLEQTVQLAKEKYDELAKGQWVKVPVQRERVVQHAAPAPSVSRPSPPANLDKLKERASRMNELFDMGAVSAVQRDAARRAYESALSESRAPAPSNYSSETTTTVERYTEYVDEFRPTPAVILAGAEQAIKQAELALNAAKQEARETDVIAPVSGTIYYGVEIDQELSAGDSISKIGDSRELWLEAEVSEEVFNKIPLGKLASYVIDGKEIFGTVVEKIKPNVDEKSDESEKSDEPEKPVELPAIPVTENAPAPLIGENHPAEENQPAEENLQPPKIPEKFEEQEKPNDKFIVKISLPADREFDCAPNTETVVKIHLNTKN